MVCYYFIESALLLVVLSVVVLLLVTWVYRYNREERLLIVCDVLSRFIFLLSCLEMRVFGVVYHDSMLGFDNGLVFFKDKLGSDKFFTNRGSGVKFDLFGNRYNFLLRKGGKLDSYFGGLSCDGILNALSASEKFGKRNVELLKDLGEVIAKDFKSSLYRVDDVGYERDYYNLRWLNMMSESSFWEFLVGYVESDGSIDFKKKRLDITSKYTNKELLYAIKSRLEGCDVAPVITKADRDAFCLKGNYRLRVTSTDFDKVINRLEELKFVGLEKRGLDELQLRGVVLPDISGDKLSYWRLIGLIIGDGSLVRRNDDRTLVLSVDEDWVLHSDRVYKMRLGFSYGLKVSDRSEEFLRVLGSRICGDAVKADGDPLWHIQLSGNFYYLKLYSQASGAMADKFLGDKLFGSKYRELLIYREGSNTMDHKNLYKELCASRGSKGLLDLPDDWRDMIIKRIVWCLLEDLALGRIEFSGRMSGGVRILLYLARVKFKKLK